MSESKLIGCGDNSCIFARPKGPGTNGGCRCAREPGRLAHNVRVLRQQRDELLAVAKRYAAECRLCGGHSVRRRLDVDGVPLDDVACEQCADVRLVIARAEGRSDE